MDLAVYLVKGGNVTAENTSGFATLMDGRQLRLEVSRGRNPGWASLQAHPWLSSSPLQISLPGCLLCSSPETRSLRIYPRAGAAARSKFLLRWSGPHRAPCAAAP